MCYSTVGWVPPACAPPPYHDYIYISHIKQALSRTLAFVKFSALSGSLCSDHMRPWLALLLSSHRWLRRDDSAPSPSWIHSYLCALSVPFGLLIRKILPCLIPVQLSSTRLILPVRRACVQPRSMIILLYRVRTDAHSPRMERRSPRLHPPAIMWTSPPFLPPLFPPSHPAAAGRPDSHRIPRILLAWRQSYIPETLDGRIWNIVDTISSPWQPKEQKGHFLSVLTNYSYINIFQ